MMKLEVYEFMHACNPFLAISENCWLLACSIIVLLIKYLLLRKFKMRVVLSWVTTESYWGLLGPSFYLCSYLIDAMDDSLEWVGDTIRKQIGRLDFYSHTNQNEASSMSLTSFLLIQSSFSHWFWGYQGGILVEVSNCKFHLLSTINVKRVNRYLESWFSFVNN